ncbi:phosphodiesterase [Parapusillimonas sp. SGNA-6]|nr:phosphodiesterase [Parapusillimonas sp. SGNA-6]
MLIAQISDLHIQQVGQHRELIQAEQHLAAAVDHINQLHTPPDLVAVTGDLTERGTPDEYRIVRHHLDRLHAPYIVIPGNHDDRDRLRQAWRDADYLNTGNDSPYIQYVIDTYPLRFIALDTTVPRRGEGELCDERLQWLADTLAQEPDRDTCILMHHPPFATGIRHMDELGLLRGREPFEQIIASYPNVQRILCGHLHRTIMCRVGHAIASTCPGTAHQIVLDLDPARSDLSFNFEPPGYQLHWQGPHGLVTHHALIGQFPGPYPF